MIETLNRSGSIVLRPYTFWYSISKWPDIWHFNWPEMSYQARSAIVCLLKCLKLLSQVDVARLRGAKIAWTVHNMVPHSTRYPRIEAWFWRSFRRRVDLFVHLSTAGGSWFRDLYPSTRAKQHVHLRHPAYLVPDSSQESRDSARKRLEINANATMFLLFGMLRPYKGIPAVLDAFRDFDDSKSRLVIAGFPSSDQVRDEIVGATGDDPRVSVRFGFLENQELYEFIRAADLVLIPYERFLNSGSLLLALSLARPVLVPFTPVTREIATEVGPEWVSTYDTTLTADVLAQGAQWVKSRAPSSEKPGLSKYQWESFAEDLISAYQRLMKTPSSAH